MTERNEYEAPQAHLIDGTSGGVPEGIAHYDVVVYLDEAGRRCFEFTGDDGLAMTIAIPDGTLAASVSVMINLFPRMFQFALEHDTEQENR